MTQNYFIYNGAKYASGTMIRIKQFNYITGKLHEVNAMFIAYHSDSCEYELEIDNLISMYSKSRFERVFCGVVGQNVIKHNQYQAPKKEFKFKDELDIDGMLIAWMWYVFIMAIATIFYDRIGIWIFVSVVFFNYRNKKLKEEGYK